MTHKKLCCSNKTDDKCQTTKPDDQILKVNNRPTASLLACGDNFAMLACAANFFHCVAMANNISRATDRHFPSTESAFLLMDRSGAASPRHSPGTSSGNFAAATRRSGSLSTRDAMAGVSAGLRVRHPLVCRNLLLDLRHHASLRWASSSRRRAGADPVLLVRRALPRAVRTPPGLGCGR